MSRGFHLTADNTAQDIFLSPGNSIEAALGLLEATKCSLWVHPVDYPPYPLVEKIQQTWKLRIMEIPTVAELLDASSSPHYPYTKTYDEAMGDTFCILHTSGTTGLPKPIYLSNGLLATMDAARILPPFEGDNGARPWATLYEKGDRLYSPCVLLHVSHDNYIALEMVQLTLKAGSRNLYEPFLDVPF